LNSVPTNAVAVKSGAWCPTRAVILVCGREGDRSHTHTSSSNEEDDDVAREQASTRMRRKANASARPTARRAYASGSPSLYDWRIFLRISVPRSSLTAQKSTIDHDRSSAYLCGGCCGILEAGRCRIYGSVRYREMSRAWRGIWRLASMLMRRYDSERERDIARCFRLTCDALTLLLTAVITTACTCH